MKGCNSLTFNQATMIEAMQEYLDKRLTAYSPIVTSVDASSSQAFTINVKEREDDQREARPKAG